MLWEGGTNAVTRESGDLPRAAVFSAGRGAPGETGVFSFA